MGPPDPVDPTAVDLFCPDCGYNLRGSTSDRCPECGSVVDRALLSTSIIPWLNRGGMGRWRAYWRTVWLMLRRPTQVGREVAKPIVHADTIGFRRATVFLLALLLSGVIGGAFLLQRGEITKGFGFINLGVVYGLDQTAMAWADLLLPTALGWVVWPLVPLYVFLFLQGLAGVGGYWFHPHAIPVEQQNRALALSHLTGAPLLLLPLAIGLFAGAAALVGWVDRALGIGGADGVPQAAIVSTFVGAFVLGGWSIWMFWWGTLRLLRAATNASASRQIAAGVLLPLSWLAITLLTLVGLPWTVGFASLVLASLA